MAAPGPTRVRCRSHSSTASSTSAAIAKAAEPETSLAGTPPSSLMTFSAATYTAKGATNNAPEFKKKAPLALLTAGAAAPQTPPRQHDCHTPHHGDNYY